MDIKGRLLELVTDTADGRMSHTKVGMILAGTVFSYKMVIDLPEDPFLWLCYMGTVGGYAIAKQFVNARYGAAPTTPRTE